MNISMKPKTEHEHEFENEHDQYHEHEHQHDNEHEHKNDYLHEHEHETWKPSEGHPQGADSNPISLIFCGKTGPGKQKHWKTKKNLENKKLARDQARTLSVA